MFKVCRNYAFGTRGHAHQIFKYLNLNRHVKQDLENKMRVMIDKEMLSYVKREFIKNIHENSIYQPKQYDPSLVCVNVRRIISSSLNIATTSECSVGDKCLFNRISEY